MTKKLIMVIIRAINEQDQEIIINFFIIYDYTDLDQITLAYATTIHKVTRLGISCGLSLPPITMQLYDANTIYNRYHKR